VEQLSFSPDKRTLVSASQRWLKLWNLATRREVAVFQLPGKVLATGFRPDGNWLVIQTPGLVQAWHAPSLDSIQIKLESASAQLASVSRGQFSGPSQRAASEIGDSLSAKTRPDMACSLL
jgi:WD40 repeat protein